MQDILYKASIQVAPRKVMYLPGGYHVARDSEIIYHFYNVSSDANGAMRAIGAANQIRNSQFWKVELPPERAGEALNDLLLGFLDKSKVKQLVESGQATAEVSNAIAAGEISETLPRLLSESVLPFRESPVSGKSILDIVKNPNAIAVFVVLTAGDRAPMVVAILPVGIVAMHVATKAANRISAWVDKKLKEWLK